MYCKKVHHISQTLKNLFNAGTCTAVCGVLVMALPIPIIVNKFAATYDEQRKKEKHLRQKEEREKAIKKEKELDQQDLIIKDARSESVTPIGT